MTRAEFIATLVKDLPVVLMDQDRTLSAWYLALEDYATVHYNIHTEMERSTSRP